MLHNTFLYRNLNFKCELIQIILNICVLMFPIWIPKYLYILIIVKFQLYIVFIIWLFQLII